MDGREEPRNGRRQITTDYGGESFSAATTGTCREVQSAFSTASAVNEFVKNAFFLHTKIPSYYQSFNDFRLFVSYTSSVQFSQLTVY